MGTRRVRTVAADDWDDGWGDSSWGASSWDSGGWDEGYVKPKAAAKSTAKAAPKSIPGMAKAAPKGKAAAKEKAAAKSTAKASAAEKPKDFNPPAREEKEDETPVVIPPEAPADERPNISLVVVGHVDAGKSTLMGHLLCLVGLVSSKQLHKFEKDSKQIGKASFAFAWVLDEGEDERERGVTIDVCVKHFETKSRRFTILDAPGHRDFVPNMLQGAVQADVAILVADSSHFEAGFDRGGQTKEHLQLIRALGISNVVVAVNKLDTQKWSEKVFEDLKRRLHDYITGPEVGYKDEQVSYVPLSGFTGENMLERKEAALSWWKGPTLIEALDQLPSPTRPPANGPLRICLSDVYKSGSNTLLAGKVESGTVTTGQKVVLLPSGEQTTVKSLLFRETPTRSARCGDYLDSVLVPVEPQFAQIGGVVCDIKNPVPVSDTLQVQVVIFDTEIPLMRGAQLMCYLHTETLTATLVRLEKLLVKGVPEEKRPKCLVKGNNAIVWIQVSQKVCVEPKPKTGPATSLSRLVLRDRGKTVGAGVVLAVQ
eukprot:TRINITY_DN79885_c0_g1_i1.p1 TRINITY_DN79885_c0_g1~~TRINITY_DN79885_c0_g1_i1.p1  ORF type:complete len:540 (-),score=140.58 TRINITY_DN79885_c0_g1_i1:44-1663(-)